jgi:hypothetical protein
MNQSRLSINISKELKTQLIIGAVCLLIGFVVGVVIMKTWFNGDSAAIKELKKQEQQKRELLKKEIDSISSNEEKLIKYIDRVSKTHDSLMIVKENYYKYKIKVLQTTKNEEINRINSVDSAYLDILSR